MPATSISTSTLLSESNKSSEATSQTSQSSSSNKDSTTQEENSSTNNSQSVSSSNSQVSIDYGTLTIEDVVLENIGSSYTITPVFSNPEYSENISYSFEGADIAISENTIYALTNQAEVIVTATTSHHSTTFKVTISVDYGTLTIDNVMVEHGKTATINPVFSNPTYQEEINYFFQGGDISIENGIITGNTAEAIVEVTASTSHHTTTFTVTVGAPYITAITLSGQKTSFSYNEAFSTGSLVVKATYSDNSTKNLSTSQYSVDSSKYAKTTPGTYTITVTASGISKTYNVTVKENYGTLTIANVTTYGGFYVDATPKFSTTAGQSTITYTYDTSALSISGNRIQSKLSTAGSYKVTAKTSYHTTEFTVTVQDPASYLNSSFLSYLNTLQTNLTNFKHDSGKLTLYIGDSFFDSRNFFTDFYTRFAGKNAFTWGISSSRAEQWVWYCQKIWKYNPSSIVIHIGTNDYWDGNRNQTTVENSIKTLFTEIHKNLPNCKVYWYSIEDRLHSGADNTVTHNVNTTIKSYANSNSTWLKYLDSYTPTKNNTTLYRDDVHLKTPDGYNVMTNLLTSAGFSFTNNSQYATIGNYTTSTSDTFASSKIMPNAKGKFVWKSNITINSYNNNAHITLNFNGLSSDRFLMWNSQNDGKFYATGAVGGILHNTSSYSINAASTKTFELAVLSTGSNGYLFVNKTLVAVYTQLNNVETFYVGSEGCSITFASNAVYTSSSNTTDYNTYYNISGVSEFENYKIGGKELIDVKATNSITDTTVSSLETAYTAVSTRTTAFVWEAIAKVNSGSANAHISLGLAGNHSSSRFLIWDSDATYDGTFKITGMGSDGGQPSGNLTWIGLSSSAVHIAVYYDTIHAYLFINGRMEICYVNAAKALTGGASLSVGVQSCNVTFTRNRVLTSGSRFNVFTKKHGVSRYTGDTNLINNFGSFMYSDLERNRIADFTRVSGTDTNSNLVDMGLSGAFAWRAYVNVTSYTSNAHITLTFNGDSNTRFLIWNSRSDGKFYYGGAVIGGRSYYKETSTDYYNASGKTSFGIQLEVYYDGTNAYLFVDYDLKLVYTNISVTSFSVGTEGISATFSSVYRYKGGNTEYYGKNNYYEYTQRASVGTFKAGMKGNAQVSLCEQ